MRQINKLRKRGREPCVEVVAQESINGPRHGIINPVLLQGVSQTQSHVRWMKWPRNPSSHNLRIGGCFVCASVSCRRSGGVWGQFVWGQICGVASHVSLCLPPSLPLCPIQFPAQLIFFFFFFSFSFSFCSGCVKQRRGRRGRSIFFPSFRTCYFLRPLSLSLSLCGIHAHFSFHPSFCERRAARNRGGTDEGGAPRLFELKKE